MDLIYVTNFTQSLADMNSASVEMYDTVCCDFVLYAGGASSSMISIHVIALRVLSTYIHVYV